MDAGRWHFLGSQRVELKARPFFLLAFIEFWTNVFDAKSFVKQCIKNA